MVVKYLLAFYCRCWLPGTIAHWESVFRKNVREIQGDGMQVELGSVCFSSSLWCLWSSMKSTLSCLHRQDRGVKGVGGTGEKSRLLDSRSGYLNLSCLDVSSAQETDLGTTLRLAQPGYWRYVVICAQRWLNFLEIVGGRSHCCHCHHHCGGYL